MLQNLIQSRVILGRYNIFELKSYPVFNTQTKGLAV